MSGFTDGMDLCERCGKLREYRRLHNGVCIDRSSCVERKDVTPSKGLQGDPLTLWQSRDSQFHMGFRLSPGSYT